MICENNIDIRDFSRELAPHFDIINRQWISAMFTLEALDEAMLTSPYEKIVKPGGYVWFAEHPVFGVVGTCALYKKAPGVFELTKMGVLESARGLKVGELLLQHVLCQANKMDLGCLFLLTNSKCEAAIHLYEKNGFMHDNQIMQDYGKAYERCNVAMQYKKPIR